MNFKIIILFLFFSSPFLFGKKLMLATCEMGNGCTFQLSELDAHEYDIVEGTDGYYEGLPENAILVDTKIEGNWEKYVETGMTRSQLDKFYGGDGFTMIYPFNPNFQPLDGKWKVQFGTVVGNKCFGQKSNLFKSLLSGKIQSGNINFPKPFHPRVMLDVPQVKWYRITPNKYRGYFGESVMNVVYDVRLMSYEKIEGLFTVTIKVPTKEDCINKIPVTLTCIKPEDQEDPWEEWIDPSPHVPILEDESHTTVEILEDEPATEVPILEDEPKPNVPILED